MDLVNALTQIIQAILIFTVAIAALAVVARYIIIPVLEFILGK